MSHKPSGCLARKHRHPTDRRRHPWAARTGCHCALGRRRSAKRPSDGALDATASDPRPAGKEDHDEGPAPASRAARRPPLVSRRRSPPRSADRLSSGGRADGGRPAGARRPDPAEANSCSRRSSRRISEARPGSERWTSEPLTSCRRTALGSQPRANPAGADRAVRSWPVCGRRRRHGRRRSAGDGAAV
jgi:hypothetical protein